MTHELLRLSDWLKEAGCTHMAMESTGVYWKPVFNILETDFEVILVNARHIKNVPGRKTDIKDCQWIAQLLQHGLLSGSFIPPKPIRELRDLTPQRRKLIDERSSVVQRVQKVLEDANIKLASVATDIMGKSGWDILSAIVSGESDPNKLTILARGKLKSKKEQLVASLQGNITEHHRFLLKQHQTTKGSKWLKAALIGSAWAAGRTKGTYMRSHYRRLASQRGRKRALVAVGHTIVIIAFHIMRDHKPYYELGEDFFEKLNMDRLKYYYSRRLEALGYKVELTKNAAA
jgi:transposase